MTASAAARSAPAVARGGGCAAAASSATTLGTVERPALGERSEADAIAAAAVADSARPVPSASGGAMRTALCAAAIDAAGDAAGSGRTPGEAAPLVLVPGYMLDEALWDGLRPALSAAGQGASRKLVHVALAGGETIEEMARAALQASPAGRFDLLGFSMGGYVARAMVRQAPERVRKLVLVATSSRADTPLQITQRQTAARAKPIGPFRGLGRAAIIQSLHPANAANEALVAQVREMGARLGRAAFVQQSVVVRDSDADKLAEIQCPTLVIGAAQDQMRSPGEARELAQGIPGARLEIIEDSGHMIPLEQPDRLAALIGGWLHD
jgi:pimeloyl-ACP methyl ester carboxylesterase